jgi:hypothetical protein
MFKTTLTAIALSAAIALAAPASAAPGPYGLKHCIASVLQMYDAPAYGLAYVEDLEAHMVNTLHISPDKALDHMIAAWQSNWPLLKHCKD